MQTKPKPIIYLNLTSSKLLYPKTFVRPSGQQNVWTSRLPLFTFKCPTGQFEVFLIIRKANKKRKHTKYNHKSGTKRTNSDYSFANFL